MDAADELVHSGLSKLGYECACNEQHLASEFSTNIHRLSLDVIIDDCWHAPTRDPNPPYAPRADEHRFSYGIKALASEPIVIHLSFFL